MSVDPGATEFKPRMPDPAGWGWVRFIVDHNPCFLLSALSMFAGCYLLNSAMDVRAADVGKSLILLATINLYELALIGLGLALVKKTGGPGRDGVLLLVVQMLFLADGAFLIAQLAQAGGRWGWVIALGLGGLALVKAMVVLKGARIRVCARTFGFLAVQVGLIYGLPVVFSHCAVDGELAAGPMYAAWWAVGLLPALYEITARFQPLEEMGSRREFVRRGLVIVPWLLLAAHVAFFHYVYRAEFFAGELSPVLLGLAVAMRRVKAGKMLPAKELRLVRMALPVFAVLLAMLGPGPAMVWLHGEAVVPTVLLTMAAAMVVYGYFVSLRAAGCAAAAIAMMGTGWWLRTDILAAIQRAFDASGAAMQWVLKYVPSSTEAWGILAIVSAFVLLGLGGLWSLRPRAVERPPTEPLA